MFSSRSEVAKVDLIPEDQFRLLAPPELQLKGDEADPQHTLLLNRLQFELHQRKEYVHFTIWPFPSLVSLAVSNDILLEFSSIIEVRMTDVS